uniref:Integrin, alpha 5 (fibronectin receptor, alpha polypeptide) n=1 Tax=Oryzias sinensis TaxID=183150 RepID=A0A8C7WRL2_9TELE
TQLPPRSTGYLTSHINTPVCEAFNLDEMNPTVYSGPEGSFFGYAVEFYLPDSASASVVIGAPKANTSQINITEGGSVFYCPWSPGQTHCDSIEFDTEETLFSVLLQLEKHLQYTPHSDVTGTCYLSVQNFTKFVEYAPCRTEFSDREGQGYCQGGFSADFTMNGKVVLGGPGSYFWQGQVISAAKENIIRAYYPGYFIQAVDGQMQTKQGQSSHDDNYQGYSVAVGEFSGDEVEGKTIQTFFCSFVSILNGTDLTTMVEYTGEQMGSYFGYALATTDINNDGMTDLLVGAPMFIVRGSDSHLEEMGRVYVYLQRSPLKLELRLPHQTGTQMYGRFGSSIAALGDLNQDGFNDVAISCPFGGEDQKGLVYIFNGFSEGLREKPSQVIKGQWAAGAVPPSFGFSLRGAKDLDMNGYPDLIVGAFGVDKAVLYRARPIVNTSASLTVYPTMINPEEKNCMVSSGNSSIPVSCVNLSYCISADGKHLPEFLGEPILHICHKQKGAVKRALFLDSQQPLLQRSVRVRRGERLCDHTKIYLRSEKDFRDKLSSIFMALNLTLDETAANEVHGLQPILNYQSANVIERKAQILLDCGEDNICVPDLKLEVLGRRKEVYLGDDNSLTLIFNARNEGEGGAYEAELHVVLPPEADYSGIARNNESFAQLTCSYEMENQTRYLSCDLGNPMRAGANLWAGLRFTVPRLKDTHRTIQFELQIRSKNENNSHSEIVSRASVTHVLTTVLPFRSVSRPDKVYLPPANWKVPKNHEGEPDEDPAVEHIYELKNNGPSHISHTSLDVRCPLHAQANALLYRVDFSTKGPINCTLDKNITHLNLKLHPMTLNPTSVNNTLFDDPLHSIISNLRLHPHYTKRSSPRILWCWTIRCNVGLLEKGTTALVKVRSRLRAETFMERSYRQYVLECLAAYSVKKMPYAIQPKFLPNGQKKVVTPVVWNKPDIENFVPLWIIILAILAGLLLLAVLIYVLYRLGFFKRSGPYGTAMEKAQLKPQAASEA